MFLLCFLRLVAHLLIFKRWEAEADVLGLPDDVVLDPAELFLLGERKMLPWGAGAVALVQLIPDLIPGFIRIFGGFYDQNTHEIIAHNPDWFEDEDEAWDEWEND